MDKRPIESSESNVKKFRKESISDETDMKNDVPSASDSSKDISSLELPVELIEYIFRLLPSHDRRSAALVCQKWWELSNRMYSKEDKFVFRGHEAFETQLSLLSGTKREILNLEFRHCTFGDSSNLLLMSEKIHSLCFRDCSLRVPIKIELFLKCYNLKEFYYTNYENYRNNDRMAELYPCSTCEVINSLLEKRFVNVNLQILRSNVIDECCIRNEALFDLFPNVKHLRFMNVFRRRCNDELVERYSKSLVPRVISVKNTLETLEIHIDVIPTLQSHNFDRLKKIYLYFNYFDTEKVPDASVINFISGLVNLQKVSLKASRVSYSARVLELWSRSIAQLIQRSLHLKRITLELPSPIFFTDEIFYALVSSNLISFKTNSSFRFKESAELFRAVLNNAYSAENKTLQVLRISTYNDMDLLATSYFKCFKNLKVLDCTSDFWRGGVKSISHCPENLKNLKSLKLNYVTEHLRSLTSLESLNLILNEYDSFDCVNIPPSVKYLRLYACECSKSGEQVLRQSLLALKNVKGLEAVLLQTKDVKLTDLNLWIDICSSLKKLRLLCLHNELWQYEVDIEEGYDRFSKTHLHNLFKCCPSLRCLVVSDDFECSRLLCYDRVEKETIICKEISSEFERNDFTITETTAGSKMKFNFFPEDEINGW